MSEAQIEQLDPGESAAVRPERRTPVLGRWALGTVLVLWAIGVSMISTEIFGYRANNVIKVIAFSSSYIAGVVLSAASLVRRERRRFAIVTLVLLLAGPALLFLLAMLVWFGYGLGM